MFGFRFCDCTADMTPALPWAPRPISNRFGMPSFCASAAAAEATVAVPPLPVLPVLLVLPEEPELDELELVELEPEALEELPEELLPPAVATLEVAEVLPALSVELPPQPLKERHADRQAVIAVARSRGT